MALSTHDINNRIMVVMDSVSSTLRPHFEGFHIQDGIITLTFRPFQHPSQEESWKASLTKKIREFPGIQSVRFLSTHHRPQKSPAKSCGTKDADKAPMPKLAFPTVRHLIAVGSGKGGVGKSAVTVNLAHSLTRQGMRVGILDADIYGPSLPMMMGVHDRPSLNVHGKLTPLIKDGIALMSMGFFLETKAPLIWRGPMVSSSLIQLFRDVDWGDLDLLLIDLPPGTGDVHLTLAQKIPLTGTIIVSTPQDLALIDARKGLDMFKTLNVPILGVIENMSLFHCPHCDHETAIFNTNTVNAVCDDLGVPYLGSIPIDPAIGVAADRGVPLDRETPTALSFDKMVIPLLAVINRLA